jgi:hypothetical protein
MHSLHLSEVIKKFPFRWRLIYLGAVHRKKNNRIVYLLIYQCKVGTAVRTWTRSRMSHFQRQNTDHLRERFFEIISSARSSPTENGGAFVVHLAKPKRKSLRATVEASWFPFLAVDFRSSAFFDGSRITSVLVDARPSGTPKIHRRSTLIEASPVIIQ